MYNKIKKHVADLSREIGTDIEYQFEFYVTDPIQPWGYGRESHAIRASGYQTISRVSAQHILEITKDDFFRREDTKE